MESKHENYRTADILGAGFLANVIMCHHRNPARKLRGLVKLIESLQIGVLFGNYNEPLDAYGKRLLRAILVEIDPLIQETRKGNKSALLVGGE